MVCGTEIYELSAAEIPLGQVKDEVFEQTLLPPDASRTEIEKTRSRSHWKHNRLHCELTANSGLCVLQQRLVAVRKGLACLQ
jgi:hypothetical protein